MNIGFDFDGVIANSHPLKSIVAREKYGVEISSAQFRRKNIVGAVLTADQYQSVNEAVFGGTYDIEPVKESLYYVQALRSHGYGLKIVTSRTGQMLAAASNWLRQKNVADIHIVGVGKEITKLEACKGLDVYVDDSVQKLAPLVGHVKHLLVFCWDYNSHEQAPAGVTKVASWYDIYNYIRYEV